MNAGRVEQISPPRQLYTRPQSIFVAKFIGANTLISGTALTTSASTALIETAFGTLEAMAPATAIIPGTAASIVLPAEAMQVLPANTSESEMRAAYGPNVIPCVISRLQMVGHLTQIGLTLSSGEVVSLEGHAEKYRDTLKAGTMGFVAW